MIESRNNNFYLVLGLILIVAFSRLIPHYPNFTPLCAIALFGAKYFNNKYLAYVLPLFALWLSDIIINNFVLGEYFNEFTLFYSGFYWQYGSFMLITLFGRLTLKNVSGELEADLKNVISKIDLSSILLETDSPYLSPEPNRGKINEPSNIIYVAEKLSDILSVPIKLVSQVTSQNANNLFDLSS